MSDEVPAPTNNDIPVQFPSYPPPAPGIPVASRDQAKPIQKIISRMFKGPRRIGKVPQRTMGKHHKVRFY